MYYSSENSDTEASSSADVASLDFSYLMLDVESLSVHLRNSLREQNESRKAIVKRQPNVIWANSGSSVNTKKISNPLDSMPVQKHNVSNGTRPRSRLVHDNDMLSGMTSISDDDDNFRDTLTNKLYLQNNMLLTVPFELVRFSKLKSLDLSNNSLSHINDFILQLPELQSLYLKNNNLSDDGLPKDLPLLSNLKEINLSGNQLTRFPVQMYEMNNLKYLYLGNNHITEILPEVEAMQSLNVLHLGGNLLREVPQELGKLHHLQALVLCENQLRNLPRSIANLTCLRSLLLHKNDLCCLPVEIVKLRGLLELSLRDNPLVTKFVNSCAKELMYTAPTLLELAARVIKLKKIPYTVRDLPASLICYLTSGHRCVNPNCKGMYFTSCVEHIKFVDFCGMYRVPLMHYLCSSRCSSKTPAYYAAATSESDSEDDEPNARMKKVLLG